PAPGTSSASARSRVPRKVTVAPSAQSASATAIAGTTCPAVPPAAITTRAIARWAPSASRFTGCPSLFSEHPRTTALDHAESRRAPGRGVSAAATAASRCPGGGRFVGDVQDQAGGRQGEDQAGPPVGDEGERHPGQGRQTEHGEEVEGRLGEDQGG